MRPIVHRFLILGLGLAGIWLTGCLGYKAGDPGNTPYRRIYVPVVENRSPAPQMRALLTDQVRRQLADDSRVVLVASEDEAQANLSIVIEDYRREGIASAADDSGRDIAFRLVVRARVSLLGDDQAAGLKDVMVEADTLVFTAPNLVDAETQAAGTLATELARRIRDRVLGGW